MIKPPGFRELYQLAGLSLPWIPGTSRRFCSRSLPPPCCPVFEKCPSAPWGPGICHKIAIRSTRNKTSTAWTQQWVDDSGIPGFCCSYSVIRIQESCQRQACAQKCTATDRVTNHYRKQVDLHFIKGQGSRKVAGELWCLVGFPKPQGERIPCFGRGTSLGPLK